MGRKHSKHLMDLSCFLHRVVISIKESECENFVYCIVFLWFLWTEKKSDNNVVSKDFFFLHESPGEKWILQHEIVWLHITTLTGAAATQYIGLYMDYCFLIKRKIVGTRTAHLSRNASGLLKSVLPGVSAPLLWLSKSWEDKCDTKSSYIASFNLCGTARSMYLQREEVQHKFPN